MKTIYLIKEISFSVQQEIITKQAEEIEKIYLLYFGCIMHNQSEKTKNTHNKTRYKHKSNVSD